MKTRRKIRARNKEIGTITVIGEQSSEPWQLLRREKVSFGQVVKNYHEWMLQ